MTNLVTPHAPPIRRDRFGRPLILPPGGGNPEPYTRASTVAGTLDDLYGLMGWKQRQTALGLAQRKDLLLAVAAHRDDKKKLDRICEDAMQAVASSAGATTGTALHKLSEAVDRGEELPPLPDDARRDLDAYQAAMAGFDVTYIEAGVVLDDIKVHGTMDRVVTWRGQNFVADLKTGQDVTTYSQPKIAIQLALYAHGVGYRPDGTRYDLPPVNQRAGIVIHVPAGTGDATLWWVNILEGWRMVDYALETRLWRKRKDLFVPFEGSR